jgi:hypothetical protein
MTVNELLGGGRKKESEWKVMNRRSDQRKNKGAFFIILVWGGETSCTNIVVKTGMGGGERIYFRKARCEG